MKYIFLTVGIIFSLVYTIQTTTGQPPAFFIGSVIGAILFGLLISFTLAFLFCIIFTNKSKTVKTALILFPLVTLFFVFNHTFTKSTPVAKNITTLQELGTTIEDFSQTKDIAKLKTDIKSINASQYANWQKDMVLAFVADLQKFTQDTELTSELFSDKNILSSKKYMDDIIKKRKALLNKVTDDYLTQELTLLWKKQTDSLLNKCVQAFSEKQCAQARPAFDSHHLPLIITGAKKQREYMSEELSFLDYLSANYNDLDRSKNIPYFRTSKNQAVLQKKLKKLMDISEEISSLQKLSLSNMQNNINNISKKYN